MIRGIKVKLYPNKEQEILFRKSCGLARYAYNWGLNYQKENYKNGNKYIEKGDMKKLFKHFRDENEDVKWIFECSSEIPDQALCDLDDAYKRFWKGITDFPRFKSKHKSELSFYHSSNKIKVKDDMIYFEKIGWVKINDENRLIRGVYKGKNKAENAKVYNPRIKYNGKYWYLAAAIEINDMKNEEKSDIRLGIDVGLKELATCSDTKVFHNINKSKKIKKLEKKLKKEQRKSSRQLLANTDHYEKSKDKNGKDCLKPVWKKPLKECKNIEKQNNKIRCIMNKLANIRLNHQHQVSNSIVKTKPKAIVVEDLNIQGMLKNKHLSKQIHAVAWYRFIKFLEYKSEKYGIEFIKADRFYPSSKKCSKCGYIKKDLKLKNRIFKCSYCGNTIDRDLNASINLANYVQKDKLEECNI